MSFTCQVCGADCDEFGNSVGPDVDPVPPVTIITCIACRLEAIRVKRYGPKTFPKLRESYQQLPYKD